MIDAVIIFSVFLLAALSSSVAFYVKSEKREQEIKNLLDKVLKLEEEKSEIQSEAVEVLKKDGETKERIGDLITLLEQYEIFISEISTLLSGDVDFLRGSLARKLSLDIPEVQDLYRGLELFKNKIENIQNMIDEAKMIRGK